MVFGDPDDFRNHHRFFRKSCRSCSIPRWKIPSKIQQIPRKNDHFLMVHSPSTTQGDPRLHTLSLWPLLRPPPLRWRRGGRPSDGERSEIGIEMEPHGQTFHMLNIFIFDCTYLSLIVHHTHTYILLKKNLFVYEYLYSPCTYTHYIYILYYTVGSPWIPPLPTSQQKSYVLLTGPPGSPSRWVTDRPGMDGTELTRDFGCGVRPWLRKTTWNTGNGHGFLEVRYQPEKSVSERFLTQRWLEINHGSWLMGWCHHSRTCKNIIEYLCFLEHGMSDPFLGIHGN